jgi:hypothetical protein
MHVSMPNVQLTIEDDYMYLIFGQKPYNAMAGVDERLGVFRTCDVEWVMKAWIGCPDEGQVQGQVQVQAINHTM